VHRKVLAFGRLCTVKGFSLFHLVMKKFDVIHSFVARSPYRSLARWALLVLFVMSAPAFAQTTIWTDATGDWFTATNWSAGVPDSSTIAQINNGGTAQVMATGAAASEVDLGVAAGDVGTLSVSGTGMLEDVGAMNIGENGTGTLNITKGGTVSDSDAAVGANAGSTGVALVDGAGSTWSHDGAITIGGSGGTGTLTISNGGVVSSGDCILGAFNGSGTVTVDGVGSAWTISGDLSVGDASAGIGSVSISQGSQVSSTNGFIGAGSGSNGTVGIAGGNAAWQNSGNVYVGGDASGSVGTGDLHLFNNGNVGAAAITVWSTGRLTGQGFVQAALVTNHGTLAPDSIISISADLTFDSAAIMSSTVMPDAAGNVMVGGMAALDGDLNVTLTGSPFIVGMQYTLLTADGGLNGTTFSNVSITAPAGVTAQVTYDPNDVVLTIKSSGTPTPTPTGTVSPTPTSTATVSPPPTPTATVSATPTATVTPTPTSTATPRQTPTPRFVPTPRPRPTPPPRPSSDERASVQ